MGSCAWAPPVRVSRLGPGAPSAVADPLRRAGGAITEERMGATVPAGPAAPTTAGRGGRAGPARHLRTFPAGGRGVAGPAGQAATGTVTRTWLPSRVRTSKWSMSLSWSPAPPLVRRASGEPVVP